MHTSLYDQIGFYQKYFLINKTEKIEKVKTYEDLFVYLDHCQKVLDTYEKGQSMFWDSDREGFENAVKALGAFDKRKFKIDSKEAQDIISSATRHILNFAYELV
jgi:hypothetical protein